MDQQTINDLFTKLTDIHNAVLGYKLMGKEIPEDLINQLKELNEKADSEFCKYL